jgi:dienelactone hydrolase
MFATQATKINVIALILAISMISSLVIAAAEPLPEGKAKITVIVRGKTLDVFTYRPASYRDGPLIIVLHGVSRAAESYRDYAMPVADQLHAIVIAPHFTKEQFPAETYQRGGIVVNGKAQPREQWTFQCVHDLAALMRQREGRANMPYYLLGHSAGGQILHRLAAFMPGDAKRIVAANPGSLTFPTREQPYPYGFGGLPPELGGDDQIKAYLAAPLTLYLGTADLLTKDLDASPEAMLQGKSRFERGHACFEMAQSLAKKHGWPFNWRLVEAPDQGHNAGAMFGHPQVLKTFGASD